MNVSDDVTLLWSDDNRGNIRRIPLANETRRAGGSGIYYHFDYVGAPRNYKWINSVQLQKTWEQMTLAHDRGIQDIWLVNVGDLKGQVSRETMDTRCKTTDIHPHFFSGSSGRAFHGDGLGSTQLFRSG
jgi:hypothetical protein